VPGAAVSQLEVWSFRSLLLLVGLFALLCTTCCYQSNVRYKPTSMAPVARLQYIASGNTAHCMRLETVHMNINEKSKLHQAMSSYLTVNTVNSRHCGQWQHRADSAQHRHMTYLVGEGG